MLRIHSILMRIRIRDPHWKKMDPDPNAETWWTIQKWGNFYNIFFFKSSDLGFWCKKDFFCSFWLIFYPLDPDPDPGSQNLADPLNPDPNHSFKLWSDYLSRMKRIKIILFFYLKLRQRENIYFTWLSLADLSTIILVKYLFSISLATLTTRGSST